jgi:hypothetical protein
MSFFLAHHLKSYWHLAATEAKVLSQSMEEHGNVTKQIVAASEEERRQNRELLMKLIRSLYYLVKHYIPHTLSIKTIEAVVDHYKRVKNRKMAL